MKSTLAIIWFILLIAILGGIYYYSEYNNMIHLKNTAVEKWKNVEKLLKKESSSVEQIINISENDNITLDNSTVNLLKKACNKLKFANSVKSAENSRKLVEEGLKSIFSDIEKSPQLKANDKFSSAVERLDGLESKISEAINDYNAAAIQYNRKLESFPVNIMNKAMKFKRLMIFKRKESNDEEK